MYDGGLTRPQRAADGLKVDQAEGLETRQDTKGPWEYMATEASYPSDV